MIMKKKVYLQVCQVDTVYSLFLYLLLFPQNIDSTFFLFGSGIPNVIKRQFRGNSFILKKRQGGVLYSLFNICRCWILLPYTYRKYDLCKKVSYGQDHLIFSSYVLNKSLYYVLLEDGLGNYTDVEKFVRFKEDHYLRWKFCSLINSLRGVVGLPMGFHPKIKTIYLSGLMKIPPYNANKIEIFSLNDRWNALTDVYKKKILHFLCAYNAFGDSCCYDLLLLTQCFSEDVMMSEDKKIQMYKDIVEDLLNKNLKICLKSHPRERTDYSKIFPSIVIIPSYIPLELLTLISNVMIKRAVTINSTAIYNLPSTVEKVILGVDYLDKYR